MISSLKNFVKDQIIRLMLKVYSVILLTFIIVGVWKWNILPPQLPLFYSLPRSADQLGTPPLLLMLPVFSLISFISSFFLATVISEKEKLCSVLLVICSTVVSFLLLITFVQIVITIS